MALEATRIVELLREWGGSRLWYRVTALPRADSTNNVLKALALQGLPEGVVVIAEEQTAGRGSRGRRWESPRGGAWFSVLLRPPLTLDAAGCLGVWLALALAQTLRSWSALSVGVKWPNDLWIRNRKLGGVLIELLSQRERVEGIIAGVGINVNNPLPCDTRFPATSLGVETGHPVDLEQLYAALLTGLAHHYERFVRDGFAPYRSQWPRLSALGKRVFVTRGAQRFAAEVLSIDEQGKLLVRTPDARALALTAEEVSLLPVGG